METSWGFVLHRVKEIFRSYLRGMETTVFLRRGYNGGGIPILPTRHGNLGIALFLPISLCIPILPTRHGNYFSCANVRISSAFRSYLRGMETIFPYTINRHSNWIPILPTRHGNYSVRRVHEVIRGIPILPTRHGNTDELVEALKTMKNSDPTYEAWKQESI